jgi:hypothetical protein
MKNHINRALANSWRLRRHFIALCATQLITNYFSLNTSAQAPQGIPYQAIARNASGVAIASTAVKVRFSIRDSIATGAIKYQETHNPTTSALGLFSVNVGMGTVVSGTFSGINWGKNAKFLQVELDPAGGSSYTDLGTTQMMSVPYALYALKTQMGDGDTTFWKKNEKGIYLLNNPNQIGIGTNNPMAKIDVRNNDLNRNSLIVEGYVTDNAGDPPIAKISGTADGPSILEVSKVAGGSARNWACIRLGVGENLGYITSNNSGGIAISNGYHQPQGALDVYSTSGAFIVPRMTQAQRDGIQNPINGSIIYNLSTNRFNFRENGAWVTK